MNSAGFNVELQLRNKVFSDWMPFGECLHRSNEKFKIRQTLRLRTPSFIVLDENAASNI